MIPLAMKFGHMELCIRDTVEIELHTDMNMNMDMEGPLRKLTPTLMHIQAQSYSSGWDNPHLNSFSGPV
jgi:hypothetical protein